MMNKLMDCKCSESWVDAGKFILRVVLGAIFFYHGYAKFGMGNEAVAGFFSSVGIPMASLLAPLVIWIEMLGGIALILGVWTHWASKLLVIISAVAFLTVHMSKGFNVANGGYEFIVLIFASTFVIMTEGPGKWTLKKFLKMEAKGM